MSVRVLCAMSGGVDSSVAAARLVAQGYDVIGVTLHLWDYPDDGSVKGRCCAPEDLHDAIRRVAGGETLLQPVSTDPVRARFRFRDEVPPSDTFSEREVAILRLLAGGYSNKEIARTLFLAEGTVKNYVSTILDKLGTRDRTRAVLKAITLRII